MPVLQPTGVQQQVDVAELQQLVEDDVAGRALGAGTVQDERHIGFQRSQCAVHFG